jgi:DUF1009 family protein
VKRIGLIAGSGRFPIVFAEAAARAGYEVVTVAHSGASEKSLQAREWVKLGQLGKICEVLRQADVSEAVFCGGLSKPKLFDLRPDWLGVKVLAKLRSFGDDAALRAIADGLASEGVRIVSPLPFVPDLLAPRGPLTEKRLDEEQEKDATFGLHIARSLGALDIGQTVVVKRGVVLAVEAIEGTDACIARGGALAKGAVVVKARKPQQDERFDAPAIGPRTVEVCAAAGVAALVVEAGSTLVLDRSETIALADGAGLAVAGIC